MAFSWVGASSGVVSRLRGVKGGTWRRAAAMAAIVFFVARAYLRVWCARLADHVR